MPTTAIKTRAHRSKRVLKQRVAGYDDPNFDFRAYWRGRVYEHGAEELAIRTLLGDCRFKLAVDLGGGYGRLSRLLELYAERVVLAEPSSQQLTYAKEYLKRDQKVSLRQMQADNLLFDDQSVDLILMVRVLSHIAYPGAEFAEIARVLKNDGAAIIEVANHSHMLNRLRYALQGKRLPNKVVALTPSGAIKRNEFQLLSHNPETIGRQLEHAGLHVERTLSVSNLRSPRLKRLVPPQLLLLAERWLQGPLSGLLFGPSIFFLVRKSQP